MLMALFLARHHRDCQVLSPAIVLRLSAALGRVASSTLRLRPRGIGGPSTSVNMKVMEVLQQRIITRIDEYNAEQLAHLDDYYITRLCDVIAQRAILTRMADLGIGLREITKHYL